ncbi:response regulator transcription factor [Croceivirga thetidis]|uniref:Response regulator transcription factor n=1 Tax=Croceivirga thetidis TaxID=2721623 RepID=A0ABX1GPI8_9FLAO|nr:response regulator transcription factor [Croceivirga thetidis]NKI31847.1 response regulator transcription factor [Croceivirga thetidis]
MKPFFTLVAILAAYTLQGQYHFSGQVAENYINQNVYLSLVEDYRKTSRVYLNQVFQTTVADSLGFFSFEGNSLPAQNRIYRIHVDGCEEGLNGKNHFLRECSTTESLLFIANNNDTISIPLLSGQAFCEVSSSNDASGLLLEMESLKEEMIVDFIGHHSKTASSIHYDNWFKKFQEFANSTNEPLVELSVYEFLSDRKNETYNHYLESLSTSTFYNDLQNSLLETYPDSKFTEQYRKELHADENLIESDENSFAFNSNIIVSLIILIMFIIGAFYILKKRKSNKGFATLTPQEQKITEAIKSGKTNKEIATELFISHSTVKTHVNNIYKKLGVSSRTELQSKF